MRTGSPTRQCVVCRTRSEQGTLIRVVRSPDGQIRVDRERKRAAGRGAYVCHREDCLRRAAQALRRAFRGEVPTELSDELHRAAAEKNANPRENE